MKNSSFTTEEKKGPLGKPQRILKKPFFVLFAKRTTEYLVFKKKIVSLHPIKRKHDGKQLARHTNLQS